MEFAVKHARGIVYAAAAGLAGLVYVSITSHFGLTTLGKIRLAEVYGFLSAGCLYIALLIGPLYGTFRDFPGYPFMNRARRAFGVSCFLFALTHSLMSFFWLLQGFAGLPFLSGAFGINLIFAALALFILFLLFATSTDWAFETLGMYWKKLHRFAYLAGVIVFLHVLLLGSHFVSLSTPLATITVTAVLFLLLLEAARFDSFAREKWGYQLAFSPVFPFLVAILIALFSYLVIGGAHHIH